ncbi:MAG: hypothetical protein ACOC5A_05330, partial [Halanaerobiales bacterium]
GDTGTLQMEEGTGNNLEASTEWGYSPAIEYLFSARDNFTLGGGVEVVPWRKSNTGSGEDFSYINFYSAGNYRVGEKIFLRGRLGYSHFLPPEIQQVDSIDIEVGLFTGVGIGTRIKNTEYEVYYARNTTSITDLYLDQTEELIYSRTGLAVSFVF